MVLKIQEANEIRQTQETQTFTRQENNICHPHMCLYK